jgi:acetylornithine deacetylase
VPSDAADAAVDLTRRLVSIDSVNPGLSPDGAGEAVIADELADRLESAGFAVEIVPGDDPRRPSVLAVRTGARAGRTVALNGHLDTVGVEGMRDPFAARIDGDRMYGRGTSDMKGGLAGIVIAAERLAAADAPGRLVVALVADEEDRSIGATATLASLEQRRLIPDVCLIAEPTWLDLPAAHRGYQVVRVTLTGRAAHSSQPEEAVDVMPSLGRLIVAVAERDAELRAAPAHPLLAHGSLMATVARAGTAPFTVAARAEVVIERRTVPGESETAGLDEVRALVAAIEAPVDLAWDVAPLISRGAWQLLPEGAANEFAALLGTALTASGTTPGRPGAPYWMESALWQEAGVPTVVCGPAGGGLHAVDEWVDLDQLRRFPAAVETAVGRFLAG